MRKPLAIAAALLVLGIGCAPTPQPRAPTGSNAYPGTQPYVEPSAPPPGSTQ